MGQLRAPVANLQQLVNLLLVFGKGKCHLGIVYREHTLQCGSVLVERNRHSPQRLCRQHGGIQAGAIGTHHNHVRTPAQAGLMQAAGQVLHQCGQISPRQCLPDAIFFFPHGRLQRALRCVVKKKSRESGLHPGTLSSCQK